MGEKNAQNNKDAWKYRVGNDPWKNVIYEECEAVQNLLEDEKANGGGLNGDAVDVKMIDLPKKASFCYLPLTLSNTPVRSYLVFQAGRMFLVGVTREAIKKLEEIQKAIPQFPLPHHVVLLDWQENADPLSNLYNLYPQKDKWMTIWSSAWIWEETRQSLKDDFWKNLTFLTPEEGESRLESEDQPGLQNAVIAFEREMEIELALGVSLQMKYVPGRRPSLAVSFSCNHLKIDFDPLNAIEDESIFGVIKKALGEKVAPFPALNEVFSVRYGNPEAIIRNDNKSQQSAETKWVDPEPEKVWMLGTPIDLEMCGKMKSSSEFTFSPSVTCSTSIDHFPSSEMLNEKQILSKTVIAILCGGLAGQRKQDVLDPGRRLSVPSKNNEQRVLSILELRLNQLYQWASKYELTLPVLLMTSPDTHETVREQVARFEDFIQGKEERPAERASEGFAQKQQKGSLEIIYLLQQLVPEIMEDEKGNLIPVRLPDDGWKLNARGHLDFIHLLHKWLSETLGTMSPEKSLCFAIPYNNLGRLFDEETLRRLRDFEESQAEFGVEVFPMNRGESRDSRWNLMSYAVEEGNSFRLLKKTYREGMQDSPQYYSSHSWYINLGKIKDAVFPPASHIFRSGKGETWQLRQDMEQITYDFKVIPFAGDNNAQEGLYAHPRFLAVRTEDHIRSKQFHEKFQMAHEDQELPPPKEGSPTIASVRGLPFWVLSPAVMSNVWGGYEIQTLKGLSGRRKIGETWEASTHSSGPSTVYSNHRHPFPLSEILRKDNENSAELPFMAKYLDCHDSLSIQVHPNNDTAKYLSENGFDLNDESGKEESFYVIRQAPHHDFHLYLGFNRKELEPIARQLRRVLLEYIGGTEDELWECYNVLTKTLREPLKKECLEEVAKELQIADNKKQEFFVKILGPESETQEEHIPGSFTRKAKSRATKSDIQKVFEYHITKGSNKASPEGESQSSSLSLLEKEYLFAVIGLIKVIEEIVIYVADEKLQEQAVRLFDHKKRGEGRHGKKSDPGPILKYFRRQRVEQGQWGRVPPGIIHSWQGGGNFLIELAQCSDNTFRILDFGRELSELTNRGMHYVQAMYSLSPDSILDEKASERLLFMADTDEVGSKKNPAEGVADRSDAEKKLKKHKMCQSDLNYHLFKLGAKSKAGEWIKLYEERATEGESNEKGSDADGWSVLMNPDGQVHIRGQKDEHPFGRPVGRCRAILIKPGTQAEVLPSHRDDQLLYFYQRLERQDLLCISLGATKLEVALWRDGESPSIIWHSGKLQGLQELSGVNQKVDSVVEEVSTLVATLISDKRLSENIGLPKRELRLAVSWPGYIERKANEKENILHSSLIGSPTHENFIEPLHKKLALIPSLNKHWQLSSHSALILNDAMASALGEHSHPLGRLPGSKKGLILNVGSGLCAGLYPESPPNAAEDTDEVKKKQNLLSAWSAVGRWLFINPRTGQMDPRFPESRPSPKDNGPKLPQSEEDKFKDNLQKQVFREKAAYMDAGWLRTSVYLSSRGIALRFLSRAFSQKEELNNFLKAVTWEATNISDLIIGSQEPLKRFENGCKCISEQPMQFDQHKMIHRINKEAENSNNEDLKKVARALIIEVAYELAEVVKQITQMLKSIAPEYTNYAKQIVLTGAVGEHFGRIGNDLLKITMEDCLGTDFSVERSEISVSAVREAEGFVHYLNLLENSSGKE